MNVLNEYYTLHNGVRIPKLGFGTAPLKGDEAYQAVLNALKVGYRHIDTAQIYKNEEEVGRAIEDSNIPRKDLFITSKLDPKIKTYDGAIEYFEDTLRRIGTDYLDLYLIHAPWPWEDVGSDHKSGNVEAFKAMETLYKEGKVRAIGVSNFDIEDLENIFDHCETIPHVNQIKIHIGHPQDKLIAFSKNHDIQVEAYSPLGRSDVLSNDTVKALADDYKVSPAQIAIRYLLEKHLLPLPRSKNPNHIENNAAVNFVINPVDIAKLDKLTIA